jgi:hypothetical protein
VLLLPLLLLPLVWWDGQEQAQVEEVVLLVESHQQLPQGQHKLGRAA